MWIIALTAGVQRGKKVVKPKFPDPHQSNCKLATANEYFTPRIYGAFFYCRIVKSNHFVNEL